MENISREEFNRQIQVVVDLAAKLDFRPDRYCYGGLSNPTNADEGMVGSHWLRDSYNLSRSRYCAGGDPNDEEVLATVSMLASELGARITTEGDVLGMRIGCFPITWLVRFYRLAIEQVTV